MSASTADGLAPTATGSGHTVSVVCTSTEVIGPAGLCLVSASAVARSCSTSSINASRSRSCCTVSACETCWTVSVCACLNCCSSMPCWYCFTSSSDCMYRCRSAIHSLMTPSFCSRSLSSRSSDACNETTAWSRCPTARSRSCNARARLCTSVATRRLSSGHNCLSVPPSAASGSCRKLCAAFLDRLLLVLALPAMPVGSGQDRLEHYYNAPSPPARTRAWAEATCSQAHL